jgi:apolipoprotein N-acyltransferase
LADALPAGHTPLAWVAFALVLVLSRKREGGRRKERRRVGGKEGRRGFYFGITSGTEFASGLGPVLPSFLSAFPSSLCFFLILFFYFCGLFLRLCQQLDFGASKDEAKMNDELKPI